MTVQQESYEGSSSRKKLGRVSLIFVFLIDFPENDIIDLVVTLICLEKVPMKLLWGFNQMVFKVP